MSMTESEAIEVFNTILLLGKCYLPTDEAKETIKVAIKALEKQIEMERYCDENGCADCPYHNHSRKDNRCMNDFIIDKE